MNIFVTGGAGFIGKYLVKSLLEKGHKVTIYDNFCNSDKNSMLKKNEELTIVEGDILDKGKILSSMKNMDLVIHLAAKISVADSIKNPEKTFESNVLGTKNILEGCKNNEIKNLIVASTAAVYGDRNQNDVLDEKSECNPISPYGESKKNMEKVIVEFSKINEINSIILRFFNIYGKLQSAEYAGVITKFFQQIKSNNNLFIFGDGLQVRDFIHIEDVISAFNDTILNLEGNIGKIYNIASGSHITIKDLAKMILEESNKKLEICYLKEKKGDIRFSSASIDLARKEIGFVPKIKLRDGISRLLDN
jgi:UDP-glucose 4-epimerase